MATKKKLNTIITICGLSVVGIMFYRAWSTGNDFFRLVMNRISIMLCYMNYCMNHIDVAEVLLCLFVVFWIRKKYTWFSA